MKTSIVRSSINEITGEPFTSVIVDSITLSCIPRRHETIVYNNRAYVCLNVEYRISENSEDDMVVIIVDDMETYKKMIMQAQMIQGKKSSNIMSFS